MEGSTCHAGPPSPVHPLPSTPQVDVQHFKESFLDYVHPFLCRVEAVLPGASGQVLEDFLVQVAAEDLEPCLAVLQLLTDKVCGWGVLVRVGGCACEGGRVCF